MRDLRERLLTLWREKLPTLWRESSSAKRGLLVVAPALLIVVVAGGVALATSGGGGNAQQVLAPTATHVPDSPTPGITDTATPAATPTPANAGLQSTGAGASRPSANASAPRAAVNPNLSGPGAARGTAYTLSIPSISVNATVNSETVGQNGQMGNPVGAYDVILYDFSGWPGLGGMPGAAGRESGVRRTCGLLPHRSMPVPRAGGVLEHAQSPGRCDGDREHAERADQLFDPVGPVG